MEVPVERGKHGPLVGAVDQGTSSTRFLIFAAATGEVLTYHQEEVAQLFPQEGWVEQDPMQLLSSAVTCIAKAVENLKNLSIAPGDIKALGITNQRETTIVWDRTTGLPLYNAIVWLDVRTTSTVDTILARTPGQDQEALKSICGLPISTYFSAVKLRWLLDNVAAVKEAADSGTLLFGTVDTWLLWNMTGGVDGGLHITDVTNASRTMLLNLRTLKWDPGLCKFFDIPSSVLPEIRSSSEIYGYLKGGPLQGVPISGLLGDQQAALVGQMCMSRGQAKNTYGTGCFLLYNTGTQIVWSTQGLLTTVAYQFGRGAPVVYALEGSVAIAGAAVRWLRDNMGLIEKASDVQALANKVKDTAGVYFVPAFSGLYAPHWRSDARGTICGITQGTNSSHLARAALEAVCFQTREILDAMQRDSGITITKLLVDGGMTANDLLLQLQADIAGVPVVRPSMVETTALGVAMAAGAAAGIAVWDLDALMPMATDTFTPAILEDERERRYDRWCMAVERSMGWELLPHKQPKPEFERRLLGSVTPALFALGSILTFILADRIKNGSGGVSSAGVSNAAACVSALASTSSVPTALSFVSQLPASIPQLCTAPTPTIQGLRAVIESCAPSLQFPALGQHVQATYADTVQSLTQYVYCWSNWSYEACTRWAVWAAECCLGLSGRAVDMWHSVYSYVPYSCSSVTSYVYGGCSQIINVIPRLKSHLMGYSCSSIGHYAYVGLSQVFTSISTSAAAVRSFCVNCTWRLVSSLQPFPWNRLGDLFGSVKVWVCGRLHCGQLFQCGQWLVSCCSHAAHCAGSVCVSTTNTIRWLCSVLLPRLCSVALGRGSRDSIS